MYCTVWMNITEKAQSRDSLCAVRPAAALRYTVLGSVPPERRNISAFSVVDSSLLILSERDYQSVLLAPSAEVRCMYTKKPDRLCAIVAQDILYAGRT